MNPREEAISESGDITEQASQQASIKGYFFIYGVMMSIKFNKVVFLLRNFQVMQADIEVALKLLATLDALAELCLPAFLWRKYGQPVASCSYTDLQYPFCSLQRMLLSCC